MTENEQSILWIGAFRYYLGRMTYAVSDFCELLISKWDSLPTHTQYIIHRDLLEAFERDNMARESKAIYKPLGHNCDRQEWEQVLTKIRGE